MHVENGRKRVEITSSFSILPTDAAAKKEKNKTVENKEVELLFRRRRQWLRAGNPRNVFIFPILSFIRLVNFSGSFIKNKKEEKKRKACSFAYRFIIWRLAAVPAVPATPAAADVRENRTEKKRNFEEKNKICNSNDTMKTKHDPLFVLFSFLFSPLYSAHTIQTHRHFYSPPCDSLLGHARTRIELIQTASECISNALTQSTTSNSSF